MKTIIVEDEVESLSTLRSQIARYCPELKVVAEARSVRDALAVIRTHVPDLVFMDIMLEDGSSFELLEQLPSIPFKIVFVTAHDEHAVQAFEYNAAHYILKPLIPDKLTEAVKRATQEAQPDMNGVMETVTRLQSNRSVDRLAVVSLSKIVYVPIADILRLESDNSYTTIYLESGQQVLSTKPLKEYEKLLASHGFYRMHRSHIINLSKVIEYNKGEKDRVVLSDGSDIEVTRKKRNELIRVISHG